MMDAGLLLLRQLESPPPIVHSPVLHKETGSVLPNIHERSPSALTFHLCRPVPHQASSAPSSSLPSR